MLNHLETKSDRMRVDAHVADSLTQSMRLATIVCGLTLLGTGCASTDRNPAPARTDKSIATTNSSLGRPVMTPAKGTAGRIVSVNTTARFVVITYPFGFLPHTDQHLNVYRQNKKVGEVKVSGPQQDTSTVADLISGDLQIGDEARAD